MKTPMKLAAAVVAGLLLSAPARALGQGQAQPRAQTAEPQGQAPGQEQRGGSSSALQQKLAPGLATYTDEVLYGDVWRRTELSARDRSLVTISALIATGKSAQLVGHLGRALNNGVQPIEASGVLTHLAIIVAGPMPSRRSTSTNRSTPRGRSISRHYATFGRRSPRPPPTSQCRVGE